MNSDEAERWKAYSLALRSRGLGDDHFIPSPAEIEHAAREVQGGWDDLTRYLRSRFLSGKGRREVPAVDVSPRELRYRLHAVGGAVMDS